MRKNSPVDGFQFCIVSRVFGKAHLGSLGLARLRHRARWGLPIFCAGLAVALLAGCGSASVPIGTATEEQLSPLFAAIDRGDLETVKAELARDGNLLNQPEGAFLQTPLHKAARAKQLEIVRFLLESGADVNLFDNLSRTPLAAAMDEEAGPELIQLLEEYGAVD